LTSSLVVLLLANAFPIAGVLFLGWGVFPLVLLYWLENVIVGGFNVAKLLLAQPREPAYWAGKLFLVPFFVVHFGGFTYVHGVLVVALLGPKGVNAFDILGTIPGVIRDNHLGWAVASLVLSHGLSFFWNYIKNGEYQRASPKRADDATLRPRLRAALHGAVRGLDRHAARLAGARTRAVGSDQDRRRPARA